ncbi:MAG TPA: XdhC/CoxI family protein [Ktedonobacterales bacterium]|jgi:xanthine dehydrogenase accessory factor
MFQEIQAALARGEEVALATVVKTYGAAPCALGARLLVRAGGATAGTLGGADTDGRVARDALAALGTGQAAMFTYHLDPDGSDSVGSCGATLEVFIEPLRPEPRLLIAGSGHVGQALARLVAPLGWRVALLDDRSEFAREASLPPGIELAVGEMPELLSRRQPDSSTWIVIATRGHRTDEDVLRAALAGPTAYVGMIGSPSKVRNIFTKLLAAGVALDVLARVHAPIGLDLGAATPDEIALSIAAEMLMARHGASGAPLRERHALLAEAQAAAAAKADRRARPTPQAAPVPAE